MSPTRKAQLSLAFTVYNKARTAARQGRIDEKRLNRALGLVLSGKQRPYNTTLHSCDCPDYRRTGKPCKHIIRGWIEQRMGELPVAG